MSVLMSYMSAGAPERIWKWGGTGPERKLEHRSGAKWLKKFFVRAPPLFGSKSTISRFGERFRDGQYSLVSFLFAVLLLPPCPVICKSGGTCPRAPWSRRHGMSVSKFVPRILCKCQYSDFSRVTDSADEAAYVSCVAVSVNLTLSLLIHEFPRIWSYGL